MLLVKERSEKAPGKEGKIILTSQCKQKETENDAVELLIPTLCTMAAIRKTPVRVM